MNFYKDVHLSWLNHQLKQQVDKVGRENYWYSLWDEPRNLTEAYINAICRKYIPYGFEGVEYWYYKSPDGHVYNGFHFDKDELAEGYVPPHQVAFIQLDFDDSCVVVSDMTWGQDIPKDLTYVYGDEGRLTIFDGKYAYSEMIGAPNSVTLYLNIWLRHKPIGIERCPYTEEWEPFDHCLLPKTETCVVEYKGPLSTSTQDCGDTHQMYYMKQPAEYVIGDTLSVQDGVVDYCK